MSNPSPLRNPTTDEFQSLLSQIGNLTIAEVALQLEALGLKKSGSPDGRFLHFRDGARRVRARIDPPNVIISYNHLHLYNEAGESLNANLEVVDRQSLEAHISIGL
ncbi:MAG: hypothetical protein AB4352_11140 [Hormoscilla sp.]